MKRISPGIGTSGSLPAAAAGEAANPVDAVSAPARRASDSPQVHRRSLKNRLLSCLGMSPTDTIGATATSATCAGAAQPVRPDAAAAAQTRHGFTQSPQSSSLFTRHLRRSNRDTEMLAQSIRNGIAGLPDSIGERYQYQLSNILQRSDAKTRIALLKMLEKNVGHATHGSTDVPAFVQTPVRPAGLSIVTRIEPPGAPLVRVRFKGAAAQLPEFREQQIVAIRFRILKLPPQMASDYQILLRDVIACADSAKQGRLLDQMSRQIDEHLGR